MINFKNVSFKYGEKQILKDFSLDIKTGDRICLFGESGLGKTTLLRLIMGLEKPTGGEITGIRDKKISTVFQEDRLLPFKTVKQNLILFGDEAEALENLSALNLSAVADSYPASLSGGMARRVAIARALTHKADIYLFDEPFNGLDSDNIKTAADLILEKTKGKTFIAVTHDKGEAELLHTEILDLKCIR